MKVTELHLSVHECIKCDGTTNRVELSAFRLDDGRVHTLVELEDRDVELPAEERKLVLDAAVEVSKVGWVFTSNPEVYGYQEETFEVCGVQVNYEDVNGYTQYDGDEDSEPFVLDLTEPVELVECALEQNSQNKSASCVVLYYAGVPKRVQVVADLEARKGELPAAVDTADGVFSCKEFPTKVSKRAKLHRYECNPCG